MTVINGLFAVGSGYPGCGFTRTVYSHAAAARGPRARRSLAATGSRVAPCAQRSRSEHSANTAQGHSVKRHGPEPARPRDGHPRRPRHGPGRPAPSRDHRAPERQPRRRRPSGPQCIKKFIARTLEDARARGGRHGRHRAFVTQPLSSGGSSDLSQDGSSTPSLSATQS